MKLQDRLPDGVIVDGRKIKLDFDFRNVLQMMDIIADPDIVPEARAFLALRCLTRHPPRKKTAETMEAVKALLFPPADDEEKQTGPKITDFVQDAPMIRAAFLQVYGINLWRDKLHWLEFTDLLHGLPEGSRYIDILDIRARPLPEPTKYNQKEREWLMKAKVAHALKMSEQEQEQYYENAVKRIFGGLMRMAEGGETFRE